MIVISKTSIVISHLSIRVLFDHLHFARVEIVALGGECDVSSFHDAIVVQFNIFVRNYTFVLFSMRKNKMNLLVQVFLKKQSSFNFCFSHAGVFK